MARCSVERLMRREGPRGVVRGGYKSVTTPAKDPDDRPDLVDRNFSATRPKQLWVADLTPTCEPSQGSCMWRFS